MGDFLAAAHGSKARRELPAGDSPSHATFVMGAEATPLLALVPEPLTPLLGQEPS